MIYNAYSGSEKEYHKVCIKSGGHIFSKKGRRIHRPEGREDWLLFYVASGCEEFRLKDIVLAQEGSFILYRPGEAQIHHSPGEGTAEFYYVHFNAPDGLDLMGLESSRVYPAAPTTYARDLFEEILEELQLKKPCFEAICVADLFRLLGFFARQAAATEENPVADAKRFSLVLQKMNRDFGAKTSLAEYAEMCHLSKFHFLRSFKEQTGYPPLEYRNKIRMDHAKTLLKDGNLSVGEISATLGFSSPSYFCDAFKKKFGISPKEFCRLP